MTLNLFGCLVLLSAVSAIAQDAPKSIALTEKSNVPPKDISKAIQKGCPNVGVVGNADKSDFRLEVIGAMDQKLGQVNFGVTLLDASGKTLLSTSNPSLGNAAKDVCHAIFLAAGGRGMESPVRSTQGKVAIVVEVVDTQDLAQSPSALPRVAANTSTIHVVVNGEHTTLHCFELHKGCTTIGPGKYYGELDGDSIWLNYEMPLTHKTVRNHYKIAGSW
jgi:hypothetical protein